MKDRLIIRGGRVLMPGGNIVECDLEITDGIISGFEPEVSAGKEIDAKGAFVLPGIVDIHTHGIGHNSASDGNLKDYAEFEAKKGATAFVPTFFAPPATIAEQMRRHRRETDELGLLPQVVGFRLESPYLDHAGGGLSGDTTEINRNITEMLLDAGGGHIKIWDISPDLPGAADEVAYISSKNIICSIAHTFATIEQARAAVDSGARLVTHLFDTFQSPPHVKGGVYPVALTDYLLVEDRVTCEIIGDGTHVDPILVEKTFRCKTDTRMVFVTDSNLGAGLAPGRYTLPGGWGDVMIAGPNDGVRLIDRDMGLSGSALTPIDSFRNAIRLFGKDMGTASRVCSETPAKLLGLNKGRIEKGMDGDIIILGPELDLKYTISGGSVIFKA